MQMWHPRARARAKKLGATARLREYAGLGHSLGAAPTVAQDDFLPIDPRALSDMSHWRLGQVH